VLGIEAVKRQVGSVVEKVSQQAKQDSLLKLQVPIEPKQQEIKQKRALIR
jgi:putative DNA primase/helicase